MQTDISIHHVLLQLSKEPNRRLAVQKYLLACCGKYSKYRSGSCLEESLVIGRRYIAGRIPFVNLRRLEWKLEAEAFLIEFYRDEERKYNKWGIDTKLAADIQRVRICERLSRKEAIQYLIDLAYFIDESFAYCLWPEGAIPGNRYEKYFCKNIFAKHFQRNVA